MKSAGTARRLKRDKVVKIHVARLSSCKKFVSKREKFIIFYSIRSLTFSQWRNLRMGVI